MAVFSIINKVNKPAVALNTHLKSAILHMRLDFYHRLVNGRCVIAKEVTTLMGGFIHPIQMFIHKVINRRACRMDSAVLFYR